MGQAERGIEVATGRRQTDGLVRLSAFTRDLLALTVEAHGERAPTLLLTRTQARALQRALTQLIPQMTEPTEAATVPEAWTGQERRGTGELKER